MPLDRLNLIPSRKASIPIHHKRDMFWDGPLPHAPNKEFAKLVDAPFDGRRVGGPFAELVEVEGGHDELGKGVCAMSTAWLGRGCGVSMRGRNSFTRN